MAKYEFYMYEGELWRKDTEGNNELVDYTMMDMLNRILEKVKECYPEAYMALEERYKASAPNKIYYKYIMAKRFIKCNFAQLDSTYIDIEEIGGQITMNFERTDCPLRDECKYDGIICSPRFETRLSAKEIRVAKLWYQGLSKEEIAGMLYLSAETVNNHIRNIYKKLGIHKCSDFVKYMKENNLV